MGLCHCTSLLDINEAGRSVYFDNLAALRVRCFEFVAVADFRFLCRESVAMNRQLPSSFEMLHELQSRNRFPFFQEFFIVQLPKAIVFPPWSLFLPAMEIQHVRQ